MRKIRAKLVDFGGQRIANASDFGYLDGRFIEFPAQSITVCLTNLDPWNFCSWNDDDTVYVTKLLAQHRGDQPQNRLEMCLQFEMEPNLIFASNLRSAGFNYAKSIVSKNIAHKNSFNDFIQYLKEQKPQ